MPDAGKDYLESYAKRRGLRPKDPGAHGPSRVPSGPRKGLLLKRLYHPTVNLAVQTDKEMGGKFYRKGGHIYSFGFGEETPPSTTFGEISYPRLERKIQSATARKQRQITR